jgi:hypothetical protein
MVDAGCPVIREGTTCPRRPVIARLTVTAPGNETVVATATTDEQGRYRIHLAPGHNVLHAANTDGAPMPTAIDQQFTVTDARFTSLDIAFDSGVR